MDTYPAAAAARDLGTTTPRILRAMRRLGIKRLRRREVTQLADHLGSGAPPAGLTRTQARVLAALAHSPRGLASVRAVARRANVSPTACGAAIDHLVARGLVTMSDVMLAMGSAQEKRVYGVDVTAPEWADVAPVLSTIRVPVGPHSTAKVVPFHLRHLFWNVAEDQLSVASSAPFIARRLIGLGDPDGLAWGAGHLPPSAWEHAARTRGLSERMRALAINLSRGEHATA